MKDIKRRLSTIPKRGDGPHLLRKDRVEHLEREINDSLIKNETIEIKLKKHLNRTMRKYHDQQENMLKK